MVLAGLPSNALRIMAGDMGAVGSTIIFNRVQLPAVAFAKACGLRALHREDTKLSIPDGEIIYEVLRVKNSHPLFLREHVTRLAASLKLSTSGALYHSPVTSMSNTDPDAALLPKESALFTEGDVAGRLTIAGHYCSGPGGIDALSRDIMDSVKALVALHPDLEQNVKIFVFLERRLHQQEKLTQSDDSVHHSSQQVESANRTTMRWCFSFCAYFVKAFYPPPAMYAEGVHLSILRDTRRETPNAKIIQATVRERAVEQQRTTGAFEVLLCRPDGLIPEGSRSNYFLVDSADGSVHMSLDEDVLLGITRLAVEKCCAQLGIRVVKRQLFESDIKKAGAIAMTGTSVGVIPVARVDDLRFDSANHPVIKLVSEAYEAAARAGLDDEDKDISAS